MHTQIVIDERILDVKFSVDFGSKPFTFGFDSPPEPGELNILTVSENGQEVKDVDMDTVEDRCWDSLSPRDDD
jgi:hypothetical protein